MQNRYFPYGDAPVSCDFQDIDTCRETIGLYLVLAAAHLAAVTSLTVKVI